MSKLRKSTLGSCRRDGHQFVSLYIKENQLYVANNDSDSIHRLTMEGSFIDEFSANGATGFVIDEYYRMFVSDCSLNKINVFNHKGYQIFTIDGNVTVTVVSSYHMVLHLTLWGIFMLQPLDQTPSRSSPRKVSTSGSMEI